MRQFFPLEGLGGNADVDRLNDIVREDEIWAILLPILIPIWERKTFYASKKF